MYKDVEFPIVNEEVVDTATYGDIIRVIVPRPTIEDRHAYWEKERVRREGERRKKYEASICFSCIHHDACYNWAENSDWMYEQKKCEHRRVAMTPEEFAKKMKEIKDAYIDNDEDWNDVEDVHVDMDVLMMEVLESLGYVEGVTIFENTDKWYA